MDAFKVLFYGFVELCFHIVVDELSLFHFLKNFQMECLRNLLKKKIGYGPLTYHIRLFKPPLLQLYFLEQQISSEPLLQ